MTNLEQQVEEILRNYGVSVFDEWVGDWNEETKIATEAILTLIEKAEIRARGNLDRALYLAEEKGYKRGLSEWQQKNTIDANAIRSEEAQLKERSK